MTGAGGALRAGTALLLAICLWSGWNSARRIGQDLSYTRLATELNFWSREDYLPPRAVRNSTAAAVEGLLDSSPARPEYLALAARTRAWLAYYNLDPGSAKALATEAVGLQQRALALRPALLADWQALAAYADAAGREDLAAGARLRAAQLRAVPN